MNENELAPCPFCGGKAKVESCEDGPVAWCENPSCGTVVVCAYQWNTRPVEDALRAELEQARASNAELTDALGWFVAAYDWGIIGALPNGNRANGVDEGEVEGGMVLTAAINRARGNIAKGR
jgi:hypothetical protein